MNLNKEEENNSVFVLFLEHVYVIPMLLFMPFLCISSDQFVFECIIFYFNFKNVYILFLLSYRTTQKKDKMGKKRQHTFLENMYKNYVWMMVCEWEINEKK